MTHSEPWREAVRLALSESAHGQRMLATVLVLLAATIVGFNLYAPAEPTLTQRVLASALIGLCAVPSIMWASRRPWRQSLMPYVGVIYAASFAAPIFVRRDFFGSWLWWIEAEAIDDALMLALAGWIALMVGYCALARLKPWAGWPVVRLLPNDDPKLAKTVAVLAGLAAAPFLYLDNAALAAHYLGEALLPDAVAFPVTLAGQFVVFAMLVLFHLHLRDQLGIAGRVFLAVLAIYYAMLGFSTGMVGHGIKAVLALFMAYAVVAPTPTWRGVLYGALAVAVLVFVLLPTRLDYRQMIWTHGTSPYKVWHIDFRQIEMAPSAKDARGRAVQDGLRPGEERVLLETPAYSAMLRDDVIAFAHNDPATCRRQPSQPPLSATVFMRPANPDDLPEQFRKRGYLTKGFSFVKGVVENGRCVNSVNLPDFPLTSVGTMLYQLKVVFESEVVLSQPADVPSGTGTNPGAPEAHRSLAEKSAVYAKTVAGAIDGDSVSRALYLAPNRLDHLLPLAWFTQRTPEPIPHLRGSTYAPLLYKLLPRAFFADKPADVTDLGERYGLVQPDSMKNFKVHQLSEFYVNFGVAGVIIGMFLLGAFYRAVHELFHRPGVCAATMAAGTHMLTVLALEMESLLSVSLGFLIWYAIALAALALAVRAALRLQTARRRFVDAARQ